MISVPVIGLTAAAALAFAAFDFVRKKAGEHVDPVPLLLFQLVGQIPLFGLWLVIDGDYGVDENYVGLGLVAAAIGMAANILFLRALQMAPISTTIPVLSLTPVFTCAFAAWFLGEYPTISQVVGICLICAGVLMLNLRASSESLAQILWRSTHERGPLLMAIVALLWSINGPIHKELLQYTSIPMHGVIQLGLGTLILLTWLLITGRRSVLRPSRAGMPWLLASPLLGAASYGLQLLAFQVTMVAIVESVKRVVGQISALTVGRIAFGEPLTWKKGSAVATLSAGVPLTLLPI